MRLQSYIAIAIIAASQVLDAGNVQAQSVSKDIVPAEFPPSSYSGRQYVDSRGCVFIRAGVDGAVNWVPRVARDRTVICGFQPSLSQVAAAEPAATPAPAPTPTQPAAQARAVTAAPAPAARPVAVQAPAATRQPAMQIGTAAPAATAQPQPVRVVSAAPTTVARPATVAPREATCRWASAASQTYMRAPSGVNVRCGPQQAPHTSAANSAGYARGASATYTAPTTEMIRRSSLNTQPVPLQRSAAITALTRETRVVPKAVYESQVASTRGIYVPQGYQPVWQDDRLSTTRAHQTVGGLADTQFMWTNTVPRVLIERDTGKPVTHLHPDLLYPYTSYDQQQSARATISTRGTTPRDVSMLGRHQRDGLQTQRPTTSPRQVVAGTSASASAATVSTRSATAAATATATAPRAPQQAPSHRYVQVGVFADQGHAQREAQRIANSGLPIRLGKMTSSGTTYGVVISGPFATQSQVDAALNRVRGMGFSSASLRK